MLSNHMIEWVVVPLSLYLMLFGLRDRFNILHMPLADLVALFVIADVAFALNGGESAEFLSKLALDSPQPITWLLLASGGVGLCVYLVVGIEKRISNVAIHHVSVGLFHRDDVSFLQVQEALRDRRWRSFHARWSMSFALTSVYVGLQCAALGKNPLEMFGVSGFKVDALNACALGVLIYVLAYVLALVLLVLRVFRYSSSPLPVRAEQII